MDALRDRQRLLRLLPLIVWTAMPFTLGALIADALRAADEPFQTAVSVGAWAWWFGALIALAVARPFTLTIARIAVPAGLIAGVWAALESNDGTLTIIGVGAAGIAVISVFMPGVGDRFVDGVSYGNERRFLLRPPGPVLLVAGPLVGLATIAGVAGGPLLLADERWVLGSIIGAVVFVGAYLRFRTLIQLARSFPVLVLDGFVSLYPSVMLEAV
ncbi:MAG: hypothetical protein GWP48_07915, partial [Actinobacteria bacterium]|nr:hypothetical protein [Actinomycetota bacterium]